MSRATPETMIRKQILITPEQDRRLRSRAAETGLAVAEIVRAGIDAELAHEPALSDDWKTGWQQACGMWRDRDDLDAQDSDRRERRRVRRDRMNLSMARGREE